MEEQQAIKILTEQFGGNLWEKYDMRRIYFDGDDVAARQGLAFSTYGTGNVRSATLDGERISNSECKRILRAFHGFCFKLWYDLVDGKFYFEGNMDNHRGAAEMRDEFMLAAEAAIEGD